VEILNSVVDLAEKVCVGECVLNFRENRKFDGAKTLAAEAYFELIYLFTFLDGTVDCEDSECCRNSLCSQSIYCMFSNDPVEVLLRKQPPSVTASFYQRVKFLVEENSVQSYPQVDEFSER
jgi:hypothetical protein